jgi:hypothetical protein
MVFLRADVPFAASGDRAENDTPLGPNAPVRAEPTSPQTGRGTDFALAGLLRISDGKAKKRYLDDG